MNICATKEALKAWHSLQENQRARTLAATYFAPTKIKLSGGEPDAQYLHSGVKAVCASDSLSSFGKYWTDFIASMPEDGKRCVVATLNGRLLINMSGSVLENAGMALEYVCGMPVIPGSAVKGAARRYALALLQETAPEEKDALLERILTVFGCVEQDFTDKGDLPFAYGAGPNLADILKLYRNRKGCVDFLQAVPAETPKLCADVLTPHHMKYMAGVNTDPTDDEEPVPCFFPAVQGGKKAVYNFVLYAPGCPEALDDAEEWLSQALTLMGIGAKNAAGYGYFSVQPKGMDKFTMEQQEALVFIAAKQKVEPLFKDFAKLVEKDAKSRQQCWALLYLACRPAEDPSSKFAAYQAFMNRQPADKKELKAFEKAKTAITKLAEETHLTLPLV